MKCFPSAVNCYSCGDRGYYSRMACIRLPGVVFGPPNSFEKDVRINGAGNCCVWFSFCKRCYPTRALIVHSQQRVQGICEGLLGKIDELRGVKVQAKSLGEVMR